VTRFNDGVSTDSDLSKLSHAEKDALILALLARLDEAHRLIAELRARIDELTRPGKTPANSSLPPSQGQKPNRPEKAPRQGPRAGSLGRKGGGRALATEPDAVVIAKPVRCQHCQVAFAADEHALAARYDKIDLPQVRPVVTRVEQYAGRCTCCGATTLAAVPEGMEPGTPFSVNVVALAMYLRFTHAVSYRRLSRLLLDLFGLAISEGALDAAFRRARPQFDADVAAILARLRRARVIYCDETGVRVDGQGCWNWVFQNAEVVIHVVRRSRGAEVVSEVLAGHRPALWVSDLYGAQQGHAEAWQICLAHQLRDCAYAIEAGDAVFAPRMKALLLRAVVLARRHRDLAESTRREYRRRLDRDLTAVMALSPMQRDGRRLRKRYARVRDHHGVCAANHLFTFLDHPEISADNNSSERELRPTATCRKSLPPDHDPGVTGGFRSDWGADLFAAVRSIIGTAQRRGIDAYQAIRDTLRGQSALQPG
jgi:transposase